MYKAVWRGGGGSAGSSVCEVEGIGREVGVSIAFHFSCKVLLYSSDSAM